MPLGRKNGLMCKKTETTITTTQQTVTFTGVSWQKPRWGVSRTQRRRMKRSCHECKRKERAGNLNSSLTLRCSFPSPSPSCARVEVSDFSSITKHMVKTNVELFIAAAAVSQLRNDFVRVGGHLVYVVVALLFPITASKSADCVPHVGAHFLPNKYH